MEKFNFLKQNIYFKNEIDFLHYVYFYYSSDSEFHARIFVPKNELHDFNWYFYNGENKIYQKCDHIPQWFFELVNKAENEIKKRDRLRKLYKKTNE